MIIESSLLSNLSIDDNDKPIEFECRTSISNPQVQLTITRQTDDGQKHFDIQYKTSSIYINGINSIKFTVYFQLNLFSNNHFYTFSYLELIFLFMEICSLVKGH
jgi:hypothetical protein